MPAVDPTPPRSLLASDIWASAHNARNLGPISCHWCSAPAERHWFHDDPPPVPFVKSKSTALCPNSHYLCVGCWLWRKGSVTVNFLSTSSSGVRYLDRQKARDHSWYLTEEEAFAVRCPNDDCSALYDRLLAPPRRFVLALRDGPKPPEVLLQLAKANDHPEVKADTPLAFTINNVAFSYTVYELEQSIRSPEVIGGPGCQALRRILGPHSLPETKEEKRGPGRPPVDKQAERMKQHAFTSSRAVVTPSGK